MAPPQTLPSVQRATEWATAGAHQGPWLAGFLAEGEPRGVVTAQAVVPRLVEVRGTGQWLEVRGQEVGVP